MASTTIFLYPGEGVQNNVKLRDPTVLAASGATITLDSTIVLVVNDDNDPWLTESLNEPWLTEITNLPWFTEHGNFLATATVPPSLTASGSLAVATPAIAQSTASTVNTGPGSLAIANHVLSGSGLETEAGSGSVVIARPALSGVGQQAGSGSGSTAITAPALSGAVQQTESATGSIAVATPQLAGAGQQTEIATGTLAVGSPGLSGTGSQSQAASGSIELSPSLTLAGTGANLNLNITGTGSLDVQLSLSGSDSVDNGEVSRGGVVFERIRSVRRADVFAQGSVALESPSTAGQGRTYQSVTGTGALAVSVPSLSGSVVSVADVRETDILQEFSPSLIIQSGGSIPSPREVGSAPRISGIERPGESGVGPPALVAPLVEDRPAQANVAPVAARIEGRGALSVPSLAMMGQSDSSAPTVQNWTSEPWTPEQDDDVALIALLYSMVS